MRLSDFERLDVIGEGGAGVVYRARHLNTGRIVALKVMADLCDGDTTARFLREARVLSSLGHANIAEVVGAGVDDVDGPFLALELLEGGTVADLMRAMGGTLPVPVAVLVLQQLLSALDAAHRRGLVHRDIKPSNMMLTADGVLKLVDFGIAKGLGDTSLTQTGELIGTPAYMSPEQAEGADTDARSDLFACGLVLHAMLAGKSPCQGSGVLQTLQNVLRADLPLLREVSGGVPWRLEQLHSALTSRERDGRPPDAHSALERLDPIVATLGVSPGLLTQARVAPSATASEVRRAEAKRLLQDGISIASRCGPVPAMRLAFLEAGRVDPSFSEPAERLVRLPPPVTPTVDARSGDVAAVEAAVLARPRSAALWERLASAKLACADYQGAACALMRAFRLKPTAALQHQLSDVLCGPGGALDGFAASALSPRRSAMSSTEETTSPRRRAALAPLFISMVVGVAIGAAVVSGWVALTPEPPPPPPPPATIVELSSPPPPSERYVEDPTWNALLAKHGNEPCVLSLLRARSSERLPEERFFREKRYAIDSCATDVRDPSPIIGPAIVNVWAERCTTCLPAFERWKQLYEGGQLPNAPVYNVVDGLRRSDTAVFARRYRADDRLSFDPAGERYAFPNGITTFRTLVIDDRGDIVAQLNPVSPGFLEALRIAVAKTQPEASSRLIASVQIGTAPYSELTIDGRKYGMTPFFGPRTLTVPVGTHRVEFLEKQSGQRFRYQLRVLGADPNNKVVILFNKNERPKVEGRLELRRLD